MNSSRSTVLTPGFVDRRHFRLGLILVRNVWCEVPNPHRGWPAWVKTGRRNLPSHSMRLVPILRCLGINLQGHRELDKRMRRIGHHFAHHVDRRLDL
jgi:hypothetical protein